VAAPGAAVRVSAVLAVPPPEERVGVQGPASDLLLPQEYWAKIEEPKYLSPWRENFDMEGFGKEISALKKELLAQQTVEEDVSHLQGVLNWSIALYWAGVALACVCNPLQGNIFAALLISTGVMARWTMVGHHTCHGGYNRQQQKGATITGRFHRKTFAQGLMGRFLDWLDWMQPAAWDAEHNEMHHYALGEETDPDLVERNLKAMREGSFGPMAFRYVSVVFLMATWKWYYYAPNTLKEMHARLQKQAEKKGLEHEQPFKTGTKPTTIVYPFEAMFEKGRKNIVDRLTPLAKVVGCLAPYFLTTFVAIPGAAYLALGPAVGKLMLINMVVAEALTNIHSFIVIATNHVGVDIYRFATPVRPNTPEFYLRAIIGSANFHTGARVDEKGNHKPSGVIGNTIDYLHGWLNYQIEHHMFPEMSMLSYQKAQPRVKAICEKYGVPYVQEPVWERLRKTVDVMVGKSSMKQWESGI